MSKPSAGPAAMVVSIVLCVILGLTLAPAAGASFTATSQTSTSFSTATLPTPSTSTISVGNFICSPNKKALTLTIGVSGQLPFTNAISFAFSGPPQVLDMSALPQTLTVNSKQTGGGNLVTYTVMIGAVYKIPNSGNRLWTSPTPMQVVHTC